MGTNEKDKSKIELAVFNSFIEASGLPIIPNSIEKTDPPAPDILCEHESEGKIAFELVELIDQDKITRQANADKIGRRDTFQNRIYDEYEKLSIESRLEIDRRLNNAQIYFIFSEQLSKNKLKNKLGNIFEELQAIEPDFEGEIRCFENGQLKKILKEISISRGDFKGPVFTPECISGPGKPVVKILRNKHNMKYITDYPIELLAYFTFSGSMPKQMWIKETTRFFNELKEFEPYRKIWIFDFYKQSIEFVFP